MRLNRKTNDDHLEKLSNYRKVMTNSFFKCFQRPYTCLKATQSIQTSTRTPTTVYYYVANPRRVIRVNPYSGNLFGDTRAGGQPNLVSSGSGAPLARVCCGR